MLLQPIIPKPPPSYPRHNLNNLYASDVLSFSSGLLKNSTFSLKQSILTTSRRTRKKNPVFITCSSKSNLHNYGTVEYDRRPMLKWHSIYKKISMLESSDSGSASVLDQVEDGGKMFTKWELSRVVKELRKFKRYKLALEVYEWMNSRPERFIVTTSDTARQLDLIAKVHGISSAEQYFEKLPESLKDKRIYCSLLNAYVRLKMTKQAESLMDTMRSRNYANHALPFNVMMTLYMNLKDHDKIESLISEIIDKGISLDIYTYNIWLSSRGSQGSLDKMEQVFQKIELDTSIKPNWTIFCTMATIYIKSGHLEKAEECLRKIEDRITGRDRRPYHFLITLYGTAGKKEEVYRIWNIYKASFVNIHNLGYLAVISALIRLGDIEGAEKMYDEWLSVKSVYDPRVGNLLLSSYVRNGFSQKAETFFDQMIEIGGKPNTMTWETLAEDHIANTRIPEALSCLRNAAIAEGSKSWKPKPVNVSKILEIVEKDDDVASKDSLLEIMRQVGCLDDAAYMSCIPLSGGEKIGGDEVEDGNFVLLDQLQESL